MIKQIIKKKGSDAAICPYCDEVIEYLYYETLMEGWGNAELDGKYNEEKGNVFTKGKAKWFCPECNCTVLPLKGAKSSL